MKFGFDCLWSSARPERRLLLAVVAASALALAGALVSQYGFGLHPCELCLFQRVPYALLAVFGALAAWRLHGRRVLRMACWLAAAALLIETGLAWYHAGVEKGIFPGPDACSGGSKAGDSLEELRRQIMEAPLVACNQVMFEWMGISMAGWNGIVSLAGLLAVVTLLLRWRNRA